MTTNIERNDLSKWDFSKDFSVFEVACLIQGLDPSWQSERLMASDPVYKRVCLAYESALAVLTGMPCGDVSAALHEGLVPPRLYDKRNHLLSGGAVPEEDIELDRHPGNQLLNVRFGRQEVARWLKQLKLESIYKFKRDDMTPAEWHQFVAETVERHGSNKSAAARELGISQQRVSEIVNNRKTTQSQRKAKAKSGDVGAQALVEVWHNPLNSKRKK